MELNKPLISIKNLNVTFNGIVPFHALKNVNIELYSGQITALIGTSGSGKSVTSLALMGLLPTSTTISGHMYYKDVTDLTNLTALEWCRFRGNIISMIFQEPMSALNPLMTCGEQILEAYKQHHKNATHKEAFDTVIQWLEKVQIPDPPNTFYKYPHQLSGGQKQRIVIAIAMINEPELIIADEPTTALDVIVQKEILQLLKSLQLSTHTAILLITHDLAVAQSVADHILEMKAGQIIDRTLQIESVSLKESNPLNTDPILTVRNVTVNYHQGKNVVTAVNDANITIHKGTTVGLIGGSGCGKTTLSKAILGLIPIESGQIDFNGQFIEKLSSKEWRKNYRQKIQIIFQDPFAALNPRIKIGSALDEVLKVHTSLSASKRYSKVINYLQKVELAESDYHKYPHEFSGGQRQRICIARALIIEPEFVICDESVAALDIVIQKQILELLKALQEELQLTYLFITHDINVVKRICDYVYVMEKGKIVEEGLTSHIIQHAQHPYTRLLLEAVPSN